MFFIMQFDNYDNQLGIVNFGLVCRYCKRCYGFFSIDSKAVKIEPVYIKFDKNSVFSSLASKHPFIFTRASTLLLLLK